MSKENLGTGFGLHQIPGKTITAVLCCLALGSFQGCATTGTNSGGDDAPLLIPPTTPVVWNANVQAVNGPVTAAASKRHLCQSDV